MFIRLGAVIAGGGILGFAAIGDVIELKDNAALTGRVLAEKKDLVVVDLGYTVLTVPRNQIEKIIRENAETAKPAGTKSKPKATGKESPKPENVPAPTVTAAKVDGALYSAGAGTGSERSVRELASQLGEAVVQVRTPGGLGSGFFLNEDGFLITNFHVIENETVISIEVYHQQGQQLDRKAYRQIRIVAMNKFADLALLQVQDPGAPKFAFVPLSTTEQLAVGDRVFAIGSPLGLERTVTEGILSTKTREMQGELYLQTTAQINPGNSGGPLFNLRGEVVGVTNMKLTFGEGLGFAIPVDQVVFFLKNRDAYAYDNDNPSNPYRYLEPPKKMLLPSAGS